MPLLLEIVTPERLAYSDTVDAVNLPGIEGELGVLPHHAPLVSMLGRRASCGSARVARRSRSRSSAASSRSGRTRSWSWPRRPTWPPRSTSRRPAQARREAERALEGAAPDEAADLAAARAALQQALLRIRVAERRHREGPRHRG